MALASQAGRVAQDKLKISGALGLMVRWARSGEEQSKTNCDGRGRGKRGRGLRRVVQDQRRLSWGVIWRLPGVVPLHQLSRAMTRIGPALGFVACRASRASR